MTWDHAILADIAVVPRGIALANVQAATVALFTVHPGTPLARSIPIRIWPAARIPDRTIAIARATVAELGIDLAIDPWTLVEVTSVTRIVRLELELTDEHQIEDVMDGLRRSGGLDGLLLHIPTGRRLDEITLEVGNQWSFRARLLEVSATAGLFELGPGSTVEILFPGIKTGVDIVVLADCSGSMATPDLLDGGRPLQRIDALKSSLRQFVSIRRHIGGRPSRVALVSFSGTCTMEFPRRRRGMVDLHEGSDPEDFEQLEVAINALAHRPDGTDITRALQYGADLLHEHGRPDNDRFLVLITDGAEFRPEGTSSDQIGEVVYAGDPVTVIGQLHRTRSINLHAVGISTPEIFDAWRRRTGTQTYAFQVPNYRGLQDMLDAAGGDRERIGDASVLRECLTNLGRGISRTLRSIKAAQPPTLREADIAALVPKPVTIPVGTAGSAVWNDRNACEMVARLCKDLLRAIEECNEAALLHIKEPLFYIQAQVAFFRLDTRPVASSRDLFSEFIGKLHQAVGESRHPELRAKTFSLGALQPLLTRDVRIDDVRWLRNYFSHDQSQRRDPKRARQAEETLGHVRDIFTRHLAVVAPDPNDPEQWSRLQISILRGLVSLLGEALAVMRSAPAGPTPPQSGGVAAAGLLWKG